MYRFATGFAFGTWSDRASLILQLSGSTRKPAISGRRPNDGLNQNDRDVSKYWYQEFSGGR